MSGVADALASLAQVLERRRLRWFVFGAQAVAVHGVPRGTQDVDVTVEVERSGLTDLLRELADAGLVARFPELADELARLGAVVPLIHRLSGVEVDLVLAGSGLEALALDRRAEHRIAGIQVPVIAVNDLVVMKVLAGRARDRDDVAGLLAAGTVDLAEVRSLLGALEEALGQADLVPLFEEIRTASRPRSPP